MIYENVGWYAVPVDMRPVTVRRLLKRDDYREFDKVFDCRGVEDIVDVIRYIKDDRGYTFGDFTVNFGIPVRTVQNWLTGKRKPKRYEVIQLLYVMLHGLKDDNDYQALTIQARC